jgi:quercetin dioxygenase-like cupin family protein
MEIRRFGPGHRRTDRSPGSADASGAPIYVDARMQISEIVLGERGTFGPHRSLDAAVLVVIEGGGWIGIGGELARIAAGESVALPAGVDRRIATDGVPLRAILIESIDGELARVSSPSPTPPGE